MTAPAAGRIEPLAISDDITAYGQRLVRLTRLEALAGQFMVSSIEQGIVESEAYDAVALDFAEQALGIRRELAEWRAANPDSAGRW